MLTRRKMIVKSAAAVAGSAALFHRVEKVSAAPENIAQRGAEFHSPIAAEKATGRAARQPYVPVVTPNGSTLPWRMNKGVKEFHLIAEHIRQEFAPGMMVNAWGYNGSTPGPTIEIVEGEPVRIFVTNRLSEATTVHWHGIILPCGMDGVVGLTQPGIKPGETFVYEFTPLQHGTHMYHPHADEMLQMAMGMYGFLIIHPRVPERIRIDRDFAIFLAEWAIPPGTYTPNPNVMLDFDLFTFNGRVYPGTAPLVARTNQRVRIRLANLSMDSHPIHLHGTRLWITGTDGDQIPPSARWPVATVNVNPGATRDVEFVADNPGDWALHCHKNHHTMNDMDHHIPNLIGVNQAHLAKELNKVLPGGYMPMGQNGMSNMGKMHMPLPRNTLPMMSGTGEFGDVEMGGMFTVFKIRDHIRPPYADPGPYHFPPGTVAHKVEWPQPGWTE